MSWVPDDFIDLSHYKYNFTSWIKKYHSEYNEVSITCVIVWPHCIWSIILSIYEIKSNERVNFLTQNWPYMSFGIFVSVNLYYR